MFSLFIDMVAIATALATPCAGNPGLSSHPYYVCEQVGEPGGAWSCEYVQLTCVEVCS